MIGRSTKKPPPSAEDYARRDPGTWSSAAPPPQARRYGESRSAWEARRPKPGANAHASVYVPHFMQENQQRIPGKPLAPSPCPHEEQGLGSCVFRSTRTKLVAREWCGKTFPTLVEDYPPRVARRWRACAVLRCWQDGHLANVASDARRSGVCGRTNDRPPDAPPDSINAIACDRRGRALALAGSAPRRCSRGQGYRKACERGGPGPWRRRGTRSRDGGRGVIKMIATTTDGMG